MMACSSCGGNKKIPKTVLQSNKTIENTTFEVIDDEILLNGIPFVDLFSVEELRSSVNQAFLDYYKRFGVLPRIDLIGNYYRTYTNRQLKEILDNLV